MAEFHYYHLISHFARLRENDKLRNEDDKVGSWDGQFRKTSVIEIADLHKDDLDLNLYSEM
ncbi:MAG: hypothetical protein ACJA02_000457 [Myxococcota bacterium]|jgi:hypothetical protein